MRPPPCSRIDMPHPNRMAARARRLLALASVALTLAVGGCRANTPAPAEDAARMAAPALPAADQEVIARGYIERLRLGLGGPFRLIEFALVDPRLDAARRRGTAEALLRRVAGGDFARPDAATFLPVGVPDPDALATAEAHSALIERTIATADDPRTGELVVRLAYQLASVEGTVADRTFRTAVDLAALARDRALATRDARTLLAAAGRSWPAAVERVPEWRRAHRFAVEQPPLRALASTRESAALRDLPVVLGAVRIAEAASHDAPSRGGELEADPALARLTALADSMDMPPRSALVGALRTVAATLPSGLREEERAAWNDFAMQATDEERYAGSLSQVAGRFPALRPALARAAVLAAVGLRPYAQETPWYPGMGGPTAEELRDRYGVRVRFEEGVPERWRPYALRTLDSGLADLREVAPNVRFTGLQVDVTRVSPVARALASHSPGTRTLTWPILTGGGALAHEVAHDLDWQAARRAGLRGSTYASDRTLRNAAPFVNAVATLDPKGGASTRPAEIVARAFDWFVAARLATRGRWNGALSASQDDLLAGHASLRAPGSTDAYADAVLRVLDPFIEIPEEEASSFLAEYGPVRWPRAGLLLTSALARMEAIDASPPSALAAIGATRDAILGEMRAEACRASSPLVDPRTDAAYGGLVAQAASARARGLALGLARELGGAPGRAWMARELYGPLWPQAEIDPALATTLAAVAAEARALEEGRGLQAGSAFELGFAAYGCAAPALR